MGKIITALQLRSNVSDGLNFPSDDGLQSYRVTGAQIKEYVLAPQAIQNAMIKDGSVSFSKLAAALQEMLTPTASVMAFAGTSAPSGYLICNGAAVSRTTFANLFSVIGTTHGQGDGSTTFNIPDYRGRFLRGVDGGVARDPDRASRSAMNTGGNTGDNVGSIQGQATAKNGLSASSSQGTHYHDFTVWNNGTGTGGARSYVAAFSGSSGGTSGNYTPNGSSPSTQGAAPAVTTTLSGDSETRPLNAGVNWIIKI